MEGSRLSPRTAALALLCLAVLAFAAATLDTTTNPNEGLGAGSGGVDDTVGDRGTPVATDSGSSRDARPSPLDLDLGGVLFEVCVPWLARPLVQLGLIAGLVGVFLVGRWYDDALLGLGLAFIVGYPGLFVYLFLTSCLTGQRGLIPELSSIGRPSRPEGGGFAGGAAATPSLPTQLLVLLVVGLLGVVAVLVLTGDHDQATTDTESGQEEDPVEPGVDVAAIGNAAGRAADRLEREGAFENEVFRAWAEMTEQLSVAHPESSTPAEFAAAAVDAGMDPADVDRLTGLFEEVRYGGAEPTPAREQAAVETLRRIEAAYGDDGERSGEGRAGDERRGTDDGGSGG